MFEGCFQSFPFSPGDSINFMLCMCYNSLLKIEAIRRRSDAKMSAALDKNYLKDFWLYEIITLKKTQLAAYYPSK